MRALVIIDSMASKREVTPDMLAREIFTQSLHYHDVSTPEKSHAIWEVLTDDTKDEMTGRAEQIINLLLGLDPDPTDAG